MGIQQMFPRTGPDGSYKSVDLFFTNVCTVTKELCVKTLCSSCRHILYNRINHLWAFFSALSHLFCICNVKFQHLQTFLVFICILIHSRVIPQLWNQVRPETKYQADVQPFFFSKRKPILDMQGLCFLVKFSHRNHVVRLIKWLLMLFPVLESHVLRPPHKYMS